MGHTQSVPHIPTSPILWHILCWELGSPEYYITSSVLQGCTFQLRVGWFALNFSFGTSRNVILGSSLSRSPDPVSPLRRVLELPTRPKFVYLFLSGVRGDSFRGSPLGVPEVLSSRPKELAQRRRRRRTDGTGQGRSGLGSVKDLDKRVWGPDK